MSHEVATPLGGQRAQQPGSPLGEQGRLAQQVRTVWPSNRGVRVHEQQQSPGGLLDGHGVNGLESGPGRCIDQHAAIHHETGAVGPAFVRCVPPARVASEVRALLGMGGAPGILAVDRNERRLERAGKTR
jgi:hypothetical protein